MNARPLALTTLFVLGAGCHLLGGPAYYVDDDEATSGAAGGSVASQTASSSSSNAMSSSASGDCNATTCQPIDSTNDCIYATCSLEGECLPAETKDTGKACGSAGSRVCNGKGVCVECLDPGKPCPSGQICTAESTCVGSSCGDQTKGGDETDIDCGGSCAPCGPNQGCLAPQDCKSKLCHSNGKCRACVSQNDCATLQAHYCDGQDCVPKKLPGAFCATDEECFTGKCVFVLQSPIKVCGF